MQRTTLSLCVLILTAANVSPSRAQDRRVIRTSEIAGAPIEPQSGQVALSPAVQAGDGLFLSSQGGRDPKTGQYPSSFESQVKQALDNLGRVLRAAGMDFSSVVKTHVYLTDIQNFSKMNQVYREYFKTDPPARTTIAVTGLPSGAEVEFAFVAARSSKKIVQAAGDIPAPIAPYSPGVMAGETLYLSGQGSFDPKTSRLVEGPIEVHVKQTLENLGAVLRGAGLDYSNVVKANVYLTDMSHFERMNQVYRSYFKSDPPARTTVGVAALPGGTPVEITFVASRAAKTVVSPEGIRPSPNFSQAVRAGPFLYPAGKIGSGAEIASQVKSTMEGLGAVFKAAGRDFSDVVEAKIYLTDAKDYAPMNEIYQSYFKSDPPARTCIVVPRLAGGAKVEVTFLATAGRND